MLGKSIRHLNKPPHLFLFDSLGVLAFAHSRHHGRGDHTSAYDRSSSTDDCIDDDSACSSHGRTLQDSKEATSRDTANT
jgi:hypothetical protein